MRCYRAREHRTRLPDAIAATMFGHFDKLLFSMYSSVAHVICARLIITITFDFIQFNCTYI